MRLGITGWVVAILFVCVGLSMLFSSVDRLFRPSSPTHQFQTATSISASPVKPDPIFPNPVTRQPIQPVLSPRDQHLNALRLLTEARLDSESALDEIVTWNTEILPLLEQAEGANIAINDDLVKILAYVIQRERMTEQELNVGLEQIDQLRKRVDSLSAMDDPGLLSATEINLIRELHSNAKIAANSWKKAVTRALAIVRTSNRGTAPSEQPNLKEKVETSTDLKVLKELSEEQVNGPPVEETVPIMAGYPFEPSVITEVAEVALPSDLKIILVPFLEHRSLQPRMSGSVVRFETTLETAPMSLGRLTSIGALNDSVDGLKRLVAVGANRKLPEPKWQIHSMPNSWSEADREFLVKAQTMLRDYGAAMVAEGLLSQ